MGKKIDKPKQLTESEGVFYALYKAIPRDQFMDPDLSRAYDRAREILRQWGYEA